VFFLQFPGHKLSTERELGSPGSFGPPSGRLLSGDTPSLHLTPSMQSFQILQKGPAISRGPQAALHTGRMKCSVEAGRQII